MRLVAAVAPAVDAYALGVDVGEGCGGVRRQLVVGFKLAEAAVYGGAEGCAASAGASPVDAHYHISLTGEVVFPVERPAVEHLLRAGAAVLAHNHG